MSATLAITPVVMLPFAAALLAVVSGRHGGARAPAGPAESAADGAG